MFNKSGIEMLRYSLSVLYILLLSLVSCYHIHVLVRGTRCPDCTHGFHTHANLEKSLFLYSFSLMSN